MELGNRPCELEDDVLLSNELPEEEELDELPAGSPRGATSEPADGSLLIWTFGVTAAPPELMHVPELRTPQGPSAAQPERLPAGQKGNALLLNTNLSQFVVETLEGKKGKALAENTQL